MQYHHKCTTMWSSVPFMTTLTAVSGRNLRIFWFGAHHAEANKTQRRGRQKGNYTQKKIPQYNMRYDSVIARRATDSLTFYLSVGARASLGNSNLKRASRAAIILDSQQCRHRHISWITLQIHAARSFWSIFHENLTNLREVITFEGAWCRLFVVVSTFCLRLIPPE